MFKASKTASAVRLILAVGVTSVALSNVAIAQEQASEDAKKVERIEVTGSRIKRADIETASPVQVTSAEDIKISGFTKVEDMMNSLPQIEASETSFQANGATGNATVNLRGMGTNRTLVLMNGRRLQPGGINNAGAADINQIPTALVERIDVMTGGGSATYGADAVAGVVNFVMKKDFEGLQLSVGGSGYQHDNDNKYIQKLMDDKKFTYEKGNTGIDGKSATIDLAMGGSLGSKGHITAFATWRKVNELRQGARDYSSCALNAAGTSCGGSGNTVIPNFYFYPVVAGEVDYGQENYWTLDANSKFVSADGNLYNYAPVNHFMRPDERYTFGAFADYEVSEAVRPYLEVSFMNDRTIAQIAESGTFFKDEYLFDISSPLFNDAQRAQFRTAYGADVTQVAAYVGKRNVEGGPRQSDLEHTSFRIVTGSKGDLSDTWSYDLSFQHGVTASNVAYLNDFYGPRIIEALGKNCAGACKPYQIFKYQGVTSEQANYLLGTGIMKGVTSETILSGFVSGDTGVNLPTHSSTIGAVIGLEHRTNRFERTADEVYEKGLLLGQGGTTNSIRGLYHVKEVFAELNIPVLEDVTAVKDLTVGLGGRYSEYSTAGSVPTYKAEIDWTPVEDWKVRASYNRAVRAPNNAELYAPQSTGLWGGVDPCVGAKPTYTKEQCARTGVPESAYGTLSKSQASQYNGLYSGNTGLDTEEADTYTFGVVGQLTEDVSFSVDYWDVKLNNAIGVIGGASIVDQCALTGLSQWCSKIKRAPGTYSLWQGKDGYVDDKTVNLGGLHYRGIDIASSYDTEVLGGKLSLKMLGSISLKKFTDPLEGVKSGQYECSGYTSQDCFAQPKWRHTMSATYSTGDDWSVTTKWRYFGSVDYNGTTDKLLEGRGIASYSYIDLVGSYDFSEHVNLQTGINNLFDKEPPMVGTTLATNANTVAGYYDTLGRYIHATVTVSF